MGQVTLVMGQWLQEWIFRRREFPVQLQRMSFIFSVVLSILQCLSRQSCIHRTIKFIMTLSKTHDSFSTSRNEKLASSSSSSTSISLLAVTSICSTPQPPCFWTADTRAEDPKCYPWPITSEYQAAMMFFFSVRSLLLRPPRVRVTDSMVCTIRGVKRIDCHTKNNTVQCHIIKIMTLCVFKQSTGTYWIHYHSLNSILVKRFRSGDCSLSMTESSTPEGLQRKTNICKTIPDTPFLYQTLRSRIQTLSV